MDASVSASRATGDDLQQQIKKLKEQISLLNKENRDLHQSIEKLKNLEIELGKGTSH
jgi:prefoldin subunit 5